MEQSQSVSLEKGESSLRFDSLFYHLALSRNRHKTNASGLLFFFKNKLILLLVMCMAEVGYAYERRCPQKAELGDLPRNTVLGGYGSPDMGAGN